MRPNVLYFTDEQKSNFSKLYGTHGEVVLSHLLGEDIPDYFDPYNTMLFDIHMLMQHEDFPYIRPALNKATEQGLLTYNKDGNGLYMPVAPDTEDLSEADLNKLDSPTQFDSKFGNYYQHLLLSIIKPQPYMERFNTVVNNTASFFRFIKRRFEFYESLSHMETPEVKKPVGRPKVEKQVTKGESPYSRWIKACQEHKLARKEAWELYEEKRIKYNEEMEKAKQLIEGFKKEMDEAKARHAELKEAGAPRLEDFR